MRWLSLAFVAIACDGGDRDAHFGEHATGGSCSSARDGASVAGGASVDGGSDGSVSGAPGAGRGGAGGSPAAEAGADQDAGPFCPNPAIPVGWASVPGDGVDMTIGGCGGPTVTATSADELIRHAAAPSPLIIQVEGTITVSDLNLSSNKTLIGLGTNATPVGGIRVSGTSATDRASNVIIRNLRINAATSTAEHAPEDGGDGIHVWAAHHVWIDHCEIWDARDGNLDITIASDFVTVSHTRFRYTSGTAEHRFCNLVGGDDNRPDDVGKLNVTFHHNHWARNVQERMPRVRYGKVHVFNNYFHSPGNTYAIAAALESNLLVENNYFEDTDVPHQFFADNGSGVMAANGNVYDSSSGDRDERGTAFTPPYAYTLADADDVPSLVESTVGPR